MYLSSQNLWQAWQRTKSLMPGYCTSSFTSRHTVLKYKNRWKKKKRFQLPYISYYCFAQFCFFHKKYYIHCYSIYFTLFTLNIKHKLLYCSFIYFVFFSHYRKRLIKSQKYWWFLYNKWKIEIETPQPVIFFCCYAACYAVKFLLLIRFLKVTDSILLKCGLR